MRSRKRSGFTLIELVIVVAIIGILALMIIPQYNKVTEEAKTQTFIRNCKTVMSAISIWQAGHEGDLPKDTAALDKIVDGGWDSIIEIPTGAEYDYTNGVFTASYTDAFGETHQFRYPKN